MTKLRLATLNVENMRLRRARKTQAPRLSGARDDNAPSETRKGAEALDVVDRQLTARLIRDADADVVVLQEIFDRDALDYFHDTFVRQEGAQPYPHRALIDGNDGRGIDVAVMSRLPLTRVRSHAEVTFADLQVPTPSEKWSPDSRIFRRDALEVDVALGDNGSDDGDTLTLFIVHFKAMGRVRATTQPVRAAEALAVRRLIEQRFEDPASATWMVVGDLNDHAERDGAPEPDHGLAPLFDDGFTVDLLARIADPRDRWTYHYAPLDIYARPDHMLASPALAARTPDATPRILRQGMWRIAERYAGERYPEVGSHRPRASDHALVVIDLDL